MRLYEEIFKNADGFALARYTIVVGGGGYFEGVKAVGDFSPCQVVLYFQKQSLIVEGEELRISKYCDGDLEIAGKIVAIRDVDAPQTRKETNA